MSKQACRVAMSNGNSQMSNGNACKSIMVGGWWLVVVVVVVVVGCCSGGPFPSLVGLLVGRFAFSFFCIYLIEFLKNKK